MLTQDELKALMDAANKAEAEGKLGGGKFEELPEGEYYGVIEDAGMGMTQSGRTKAMFVLRITEGEHTNRKQWVNMVLEHDNPMVPMISLKSIDKLAKEFKIITPEQSVADYELDAVLEAMKDREVHFKIKKKGDYTNTYINAN